MTVASSRTRSRPAHTPAIRAHPEGGTVGDAAGGSSLAGRIEGIDVARALAIVGMVAVHVGPTDEAGVLGRVYASPYGRASLLFVLVAGVGVTLLARSRRSTTGSARITLLWRAALLLPAGLALQQLDHGVNVILAAYAALFVLAAFALTWSDRWLLGSALTLFVAGPLTHWVGYAHAPALFDRNGGTGGSVDEVVHGLTLSGPYPMITWAAPLLLGMWLGRRDLTSSRLHRQLVMVGGSVGVGAVVMSELATATAGSAVDVPGSPWRLLAATPHSQMPLWLIGSTAAAAAILGASLWAAARWPQMLRPVALAGQLALTVYVLHLLSLHVAPWLRSDDLGSAVVVVAATSLAAGLVAWTWRGQYRRGPLEAVMQPPQRLLRVLAR